MSFILKNQCEHVSCLCFFVHSIFIPLKVRKLSIFTSVLYQFVNVMLCAVLRGGHFKHVSDAEQRLLRVPVGDHLKDGEVLQHAVHHVLLGKMFQLVDEVDHVLAHWRPVDLVKVSPAFKSWPLSLHLLDNLFSKAANFCRHLDREVFITLVSAMSVNKYNAHMSFL